MWKQIEAEHYIEATKPENKYVEVKDVNDLPEDLKQNYIELYTGKLENINLGIFEKYNCLIAMGVYYSDTHDYTKALEYFRKAESLGDIGALAHIGHCYYAGHGVNMNRNKAFEYYEKAIDMGYKNYIPTLVGRDSTDYRQYKLQKDINDLKDLILSLKQNIQYLPISGAKEYNKAKEDFESNC